MNSWRDSASPAAQADLDELLAASTRFAQQKLAGRGDFYPFGVKVTVDGTLKLVDPKPPDGDDLPHLDDMVALFRSALRGKRDLLRATAVVEQVSLAGGTAIRIDLEHHDGVSLSVVQPYVRKRFSHAVTLGEPEFEASTPHIWA